MLHARRVDPKLLLAISLMGAEVSQAQPCIIFRLDKWEDEFLHEKKQDRVAITRRNVNFWIS